MNIKATLFFFPISFCYSLLSILFKIASEEQYLHQLAVEESYGKKMALINEEK